MGGLEIHVDTFSFLNSLHSLLIPNPVYSLMIIREEIALGYDKNYKSSRAASQVQCLLFPFHLELDSHELRSGKSCLERMIRNIKIYFMEQFFVFCKLSIFF